MLKRSTGEPGGRVGFLLCDHCVRAGNAAGGGGAIVSFANEHEESQLRRPLRVSDCQKHRLAFALEMADPLVQDANSPAVSALAVVLQTTAVQLQVLLEAD